MAPWTHGGLGPLQVDPSILLHTHTSLGRNKSEEIKPTLMGGWEEGVPSVGRPRDD